MSNATLEVIVCSVAEAVEAQKGGASRLEVVRELDRGGLTPAIDLVEAIRGRVDLPLRVMVREREGYGTSDETEVEKLCVAARDFAKLRVDGLVLGFLRGGEIDLDLTARVIACAPEIGMTFHHAFEDAADQLQALAEIKKLQQVDRILSSGGAGNLQMRTQRLGHYVEIAAPEITIIAGGGIDLDAISMLRRTTVVREFHVGRAAREGFQVNGRVQADLVRTLVRAIEM